MVPISEVADKLRKLFQTRVWVADGQIRVQQKSGMDFNRRRYAEDGYPVVILKPSTKKA